MNMMSWHRRLGLAAALLVAAGIAMAAVTPNSFITVQTPLDPLAQVLNATGTSPVTLVSGATNGTKVVAITCANGDSTTAYDVRLSLVNGGVTYILATVNVPINSGAVGGSTPVYPTAVLTTTNIPGLPRDSEGNPYLYLVSGDALKINTLTTVTSGAGHEVDCHAVAGNF